MKHGCQAILDRLNTFLPRSWSPLRDWSDAGVRIAVTVLFGGMFIGIVTVAVLLAPLLRGEWALLVTALFCYLLGRASR